MGDAGCAVDGDADIIIQRHLGLAGVQPHAHADGRALRPGVRGQVALCLHRCSHRIPGPGEGHKKRIPLRAHHPAAGTSHHLAQDAVVLG